MQEYKLLHHRLFSRCLLLLLMLTTSAVMVASAQEPVVGGTFRVALQSVTSLDPVFIADDMSFHVVSQVYSALARQYTNPDGSIDVIPDLAESWEYQDDGKTVIFHLRHGAMFQDGNAVFPEGESREVVAADVVYSLERTLNTEGSQAAWSDLVAAYESVEAVDDYTVKLSLNAPNALLFSPARGISSLMIYPREAVEQLGDDFASTPIGSGPFEFVEYVPDDHVTVQRNEDYWIAPNLDEVVFRIIPEDSVALIALEAGEIDMILTTPEQDIARFRDDANFMLQPLICPVARQFIFNVSAAPFQDVKVRQAISLAVDGANISKAISPETHLDGCGTAGPNITGYDPEMCSKYFNYDPTEAVALLNSVGYTDSNGDGILDKDGQPLTVPIEVWQLEPMPRVGEAVATRLREIGINVELQVVEFGTWIDDFSAGSPKMMGLTGFCGEGGTVGLFGEGGFATSMGISFPEAQAQLTQSNTIIDQAERSAAVSEAANQLYSQYLSLPVGFQQTFRLISSRVQDFGGALWWFNVVTERNNTWLSE